MKRADLLRHLRDSGCSLFRQGSKHEVWWNPENKKTSAVPRHSEINDFTARSVCRALEVQPPSRFKR
ncbi:type II toxin-antitoxin system HicA family toxin [Patescibacteria group bacterium]|nr:type II toxin-antitoxin system HicA family toxin [Patescibacteria group bacterium]